jgi:NAD-dependent dihydropyrimidine dehydrogenase PreA subunit
MEILLENCGSCGCCVLVCPEHVLELEENVLNASDGCTECGNCAMVCPIGALIPEAQI